MKVRIVAIALANILFFAIPANATPPASNGVDALDANFRFVGFSTDMVTGITGFAGMAAACTAKFGFGARIATTMEVMEIPIFVDGAIAEAWVQPVLTHAFFNGIEIERLDASGWSTSGTRATVNCRGWATDSAGFAGLTVTGDALAIELQTCDTALPVACAAPR